MVARSVPPRATRRYRLGAPRGRAVNRRSSTLEQYIGERIRRRRIQLGLTQEELAAALGCSYQQVQKYESGANRVSAANLLRLARRLSVPFDHFFVGWEDEETPADVDAGPLQSSRHTIELVRGFEAIDDPAVRGALAALVRTVFDRAVRGPGPAAGRSGSDRPRATRVGVAARD